MDNEKVLLVDFKVVHDIVSLNVEEKLRETHFVNVDCHHTDFSFYENSLIMEGRHLGVDRCPIVNAKKSHHFRGQVENRVCSYWTAALIFQIT